MAKDSSAFFRLALNYWLRMEKDYGLWRMYDYRVPGEIPQASPPRWSVVRDVPGWVG